MRKLDRTNRKNNRTYPDLNDLKDELKYLSNKCFFTDLRSDDLKVFWLNESKEIQNACLVLPEILEILNDKDQLEKQEIIGFLLGEKDIKQEYLFCLEKKFWSNERNEFLTGLSLESKSQKGNEILEVILKASDFEKQSISAFKEVETKIIDLHDLLKKLGKEETELNNFFRVYLELLRDAAEKSLTTIRSTLILNNPKYQNIKRLIRKGYLKSVSRENREKFLIEVEKREKKLKKNLIWKEWDSVVMGLVAFLDLFLYQAIIADIEKGNVPKHILSEVTYVNSLFENTEGILAVSDNRFLKDLEIEEQLLEKYDSFKGFLTGEDTKQKKKKFLDAVRLLSKVQACLKAGNYTAALQSIPIFIEVFSMSIGGNGTEKGRTGITGKIQNASQDASTQINLEEPLDLKAKILRSFWVCAKWDKCKHKEIEIVGDCCDNKDKQQCCEKRGITKLSEMSPNYVKIDDPRNKAYHEGKYLSKESFEEKLGYLIEETFGHEEDTDLLNKWYEWFGLPEQNIFDQINTKIIELVQNPERFIQ